MLPDDPAPVLLAGQTAIGKSEVALQLADRLHGEIISVDSMQVYRGMDIGTAKPSLEEQHRVPHHCLDVVDLSEPFDAAKFCELARKAVDAILARGSRPILCGGTGLYFKVFLSGLGTAPPSDPELRKTLESTPLEELVAELKRADAETFMAIDRRNPRRVVRAIEVIRLTGKPYGVVRAAWQDAERHPKYPCFGLSREPGDLRRRIEARVDRMFELGLVDETRDLLKQGLAGNRTAMQALGYRQVVEHLSGARSLEETIELVKIRTWQFARRQRTWFRRQLRVDWVHVPEAEPAGQTAARILDRLAG